MNITFLLEKDSQMLTTHPRTLSHLLSQLKQDNSPFREIGELENNTRKKTQTKEYACYNFNCTFIYFFSGNIYFKLTIYFVYLYVISDSSLPVNNICNILNATFSATHCGQDSPKKSPMQILSVMLQKVRYEYRTNILVTNIHCCFKIFTVVMAGTAIYQFNK